MIDVACCSQCGAALAEGALACSGCGAAIEPTAAPAAWPARYLVRAVRDAMAYPSLATGTSRVGALLPLLLIQVHGLTREAYGAAYQQSRDAGFSSYLNGPGLRVDPSVNSLYATDRRDPRMDLALEGRGGHGHLLRALDVTTAILDELKEPLLDDRVGLALHVMPGDYAAVVAALERATGRPAGLGWALKACFAASRADGDRGRPVGSHIEVD